MCRSDSQMKSREKLMEFPRVFELNEAFIWIRISLHETRGQNESFIDDFPLISPCCDYTWLCFHYGSDVRLLKVVVMNSLLNCFDRKIRLRTNSNAIDSEKFSGNNSSSEKFMKAFEVLLALSFGRLKVLNENLEQFHGSKES